MTPEDLQTVLSLILNEADKKDMDVLQQALERRARDLNSLGSLGFSADSLTKNVSNQIGQQMDASRQQMGAMVRRYVADLIKQQVPDIPEEHLQALLTEWVPTPEEKAHKPAPVKAPLPTEAGLAMVKDFISFSEGRMAPSKQSVLREELGDRWPEVFWERFPDRVQKLIHVYLKGKLQGEVFWDEVKQTFAGNR